MSLAHVVVDKKFELSGIKLVLGHKNSNIKVFHWRFREIPNPVKFRDCRFANSTHAIYICYSCLWGETYIIASKLFREFWWSP